MTTALVLVGVAVLIAAFSYFTNAGFGDRKPPEKSDAKKRDQASAGADETDRPLEAGLAHRRTREVEHRDRRVDGGDGERGKHAGEPDRDVAGPAAEVDDATPREVRERRPEAVDEPTIDVGEVGPRVRERVGRVVHHLRLENPLHPLLTAAGGSAAASRGILRRNGRDSQRARFGATGRSPAYGHT